MVPPRRAPRRTNAVAIASRGLPGGLPPVYGQPDSRRWMGNVTDVTPGTLAPLVNCYRNRARIPLTSAACRTFSRLGHSYARSAGALRHRRHRVRDAAWDYWGVEMGAEPFPRPDFGTLAQPAHLKAVTECGCRADSLPTSLLEVHLDMNPPDGLAVVTVGAGFELRTWRAAALARHIIEWVPDFALRPDEWATLNTGRVVEKLRRVYQATFGNGRDNGAPGEILLHAICRELYGSSTVVNKVVFKTSDNDTYKGFDGVHCVHSGAGGLELWLGEAKFKKNLTDALRSAAADIEAHFRMDYLRTEFAVVGRQVDDAHPHADEMRKLMHANTSLDEIFSKVVVPIFVTYESRATCDHHGVDDAYLRSLVGEAEAAARDLRRRIETIRAEQVRDGVPTAPMPVQVRLFLLPMTQKQLLLDELAKELASWVR